jgi:hypothetical protein
VEKPHIKIIMIAPSDEKPAGYIGAHTTYPDPHGNDYTVGNDLPDGPWNQETIESILAATRQVLQGERK